MKFIRKFAFDYNKFLIKIKNNTVFRFIRLRGNLQKIYSVPLFFQFLVFAIMIAINLLQIEEVCNFINFFFEIFISNNLFSYFNSL